MKKLYNQKFNIKYIALFSTVVLFLLICTSCEKTEEDPNKGSSSQVINTTEATEEQVLNITETTEEQVLNTTENTGENEVLNNTKEIEIVEEIPNKIVFAKKYQNKDSDATTIFFIDNEENLKFFYSTTDTSFDINDPDKYISTLEELGDETIINKYKIDGIKYCYSLLLNVDLNGSKITESSVSKEIAGQEQIMGYILDSDGKYVEITLSSADEFVIEYLDENAKRICSYLERNLPLPSSKDHHIRNNNYTKHVNENKMMEEIPNEIVFLKIFMFEDLPKKCYKIFLIDNKGDIKFFDNIPDDSFDHLSSEYFDNRDIISKLDELGEGTTIGKVDRKTLDYYYSLLLKAELKGFVVSAYFDVYSYERYLGYILDADGKYVPILLSSIGGMSLENWYEENIKEINTWLKDVLPKIPGAPFLSH